jgi:hypothetical protein
VQVIDAKEMAALQQMSAVAQAAGVSIGGNGGGRGGGRGAVSNKSGLPTEITVLGQTYRLGERSGRTWSITSSITEILKSAQREKLADLIFTIHAHEGKGTG